MSARRRLPPPLPAKPPRTVAETVEVVSAAWESHRTFSPRTTEKYAMVLRRFAGFAAANGASSFDEVDAALVRDFVGALGRNRHGHVLGEVSEGARRVRLSAMRALFAASVQAGWAEHDPSASVWPPTPGTTSRGLRPLTDQEAELVLFHVGENSSHARPSVVAVLLAGVWPSESARLLPDDLDPSSGTLRVCGGPGRSDRDVVLDERCARILSGRLAWLRQGGEEPGSLMFATLPEGERAHVRVHMAALAALRRAGLGREYGHTGASLTLVAARRALERTGRIEAAAIAVGRRSLDQVARELGWEWLPEGRGASDGRTL